ncbi:MAG: glycosyltransferase family 2 protein [Muribaculaceae bacterium]|nr:glycosyltransferase family 2 protein [Muribaculaceae bacterium]
MPLISVIIPVYNVERFVEECLRSVFAQTMRDYDVIIVDDCSTDGSMDIVHRVCDECARDINVRILSTGKTSGVSVARNMGLDASTARYVYFVDSDDYISADALEQMAAVAVKYPEAQMIYGHSSVFGDLDYLQFLDIQSKKLSSIIDNKHAAARLMLRNYYLPIPVWNRLFLRKWLNQYHLRFREGILAQDLHLNFYMAKHVESIAFSTITTYYYRFNTNNVSTKRRGFQWACVDWILCDFTRHISRKNLRAQLVLLLHMANDSYLRHRGPDAPLPPVWRKIPGAILHWMRLMRRYGKEIPKENNINQ